MRYDTVFDLVFDVFKKAGIRFVMIGGFAVNHYKVSRQTSDADFMVSTDNASKVDEVLRDNGYTCTIKRDFFSRYESDEKGSIDIDVIYVSNETLEKVLDDSKKITLVGREFNVPSLDHLIALKLHAIKNNPKRRELRDLPDIVMLIKANDVDAEDGRFKKLCLKFGNEDIYRKILSFAGDK